MNTIGKRQRDIDSKRAIIRLQLDRDAKDALDELCESRGMTQISALSRLVLWFTKQDEVIQTAVLGGLSDQSMRALARQLLDVLSKRGHDGSKIE